MTEYRFAVVTNPHDATDHTIYRARAINVAHDNSWTDYFDHSMMVGFYDEGWHGTRALDNVDSTAVEDSMRAAHAYHMAKNYGSDPHAALTRLARRLARDAEVDPRTAWDSDFICVYLDRGQDFYVLDWGGDADGSLRDEIEALNEGRIYTDEAEVYTPGAPFGDWSPAEWCGEWWYGEDQRDAGMECEYPLTEFPSELFVSADQ